MTISASAVLALTLGLGAGALLLDRQRLVRRVRRPRRMTMMVFGTAAILLPTNLYVAGHTHDGMSVEQVVVLGTIVVLGMLGIALLSDRLPRSSSTAPRRVLAVGAHPDDIELGCGGTLAKLIDSGHEVRALVMSNGEKGGDGPTRAVEGTTAGQLIGVAGVEVLSLPDTRLTLHENDMVAAVERMIDRFNPDIILTHSGNDQHQDHRAVHAATLRAGRRHSSILCYESPSATADFRPSVFVDVQDYLEVKVEAVATHDNQRGKPYMRPEHLRGLAVFRGAQAKVRHAEAYEPVRILGDPAGQL